MINIPKPVYVGSALFTTVGVIYLVKESFGGVRYEGNKNADGKVVIITGANTGIGKETAWELARRKMKVYMACRNMKRCEAAREEIVLDTKNKYVYCRPCDLASITSINEFVKRFKSEQTRLDVLINNAGVMKNKREITQDGFETHLGVNYMGHFLLTNLLLDTLKISKPSRIINVTCANYRNGTINIEDLNSENEFNPKNAYAQSKLANVLFTNELNKRFRDSGVIATSVNPGVVNSEITRHTSFYKSWTASIIIKPIMWPFIKSPKQGAQTVIYSALDPSVEDLSGKYFCNCKEDELAIIGKDEKMSRWLWRVSEKWTKLNSFITS